MEVWANLPLSPDRLRRALAGNMPLGHAAGNADYLMVHRRKNGWTQSATLVAAYRAETQPMDIPEFMTMGTLDFPGETFERWMEETAELPDPFMPERREQEPAPDEPGPEGNRTPVRPRRTALAVLPAGERGRRRDGRDGGESQE